MQLCKPALLACYFAFSAQAVAQTLPTFPSPVSPNVAEPMLTGKFQPTWTSLQQYQAPEWFRDVKFGIFAHWGPQCAPERGDWYARGMYEEGSAQYRDHVERFGHPSVFGFKDIIHDWKAENWDPEKLVALYRRAGAQYLVALANHHDNFDLYDSKYQPWNSLNMGPKKDIIGGWSKAARAAGLKFGVSVHAAHAWMWYETAQRSDRNGPRAGVPYDGKLTKADGKGLWWEGFDPQDLYAQNHPISRVQNTGQTWAWPLDGRVSIPDIAYCDKFYNRTIDLINKYKPDIVYFDDTGLPLYPVSDAGLKIAAHFYNSSMQWNNGTLDAVLTNKVLTEAQRKCMVWDIERGQSNRIEPFVWQTDTCIGNWHYDQSLFDRHRYKSAATIVRMLADIVSKNGNLLLSIPIKGDGTFDTDELAILHEIATWMDINREAIFSTRPWKVFGEGPSITAAATVRDQGFNEGTRFTPDDIRFTSKGDTLYAIVLGLPTKPIALKSLGRAAGKLTGRIASIDLLGSNESIKWTLNDEALTLQPPTAKLSEAAVVFKIQITP